MGAARLEAAFQAIEQAIVLHRTRDRCRRCGTVCLEAVLGTPTADTALREAEGLGVRRREGHCARCGKRRLVSVS